MNRSVEPVVVAGCEDTAEEVSEEVCADDVAAEAGSDETGTEEVSAGSLATDSGVDETSLTTETWDCGVMDVPGIEDCVFCVQPENAVKIITSAVMKIRIFFMMMFPLAFFRYFHYIEFMCACQESKSAETRLHKCI